MTELQYLLETLDFHYYLVNNKIMSKEIQKQVLEAQLSGLESDRKPIQDGITAIENQIKESHNQIERNRGALGYLQRLQEQIVAKLAELNSAT
jgi:chromosome segregation ATPase